MYGLEKKKKSIDDSVLRFDKTYFLLIFQCVYNDDIFILGVFHSFALCLFNENIQHKEQIFYALACFLEVKMFVNFKVCF